MIKLNCTLVIFVRNHFHTSGIYTNIFFQYITERRIMVAKNVKKGSTVKVISTAIKWQFMIKSNCIVVTFVRNHFHTSRIYTNTFLQYITKRSIMVAKNVKKGSIEKIISIDTSRLVTNIKWMMSILKNQWNKWKQYFHYFLLLSLFNLN